MCWWPRRPMWDSEDKCGGCAGLIKREKTRKGNQGHIYMDLHTSALGTKLSRNLNLTIVGYFISNNALLNFSIFVCKIEIIFS